jgi:hypothetical protein
VQYVSAIPYVVAFVAIVTATLLARSRAVWRTSAHAWRAEALRAPRQTARVVSFRVPLDVHSKRTVVGEPLFEVEDADLL